MKVVKNKSESIRSKLYSVAKNMNKDFNAILLQYAQERFLYRLSISPYRANLLLKGGMFLKFFDMPSSRPTTDIDFLGLNLQNDYVGLEN
ncbi:MAG: nucleotidyl transferase AbiEii/AbiGii toxin family protein, partial [Candidatus Zophobacter franzmannii]|nr:nucleotidyl transferase AbiEii/AbiGii toxin family protein [Candidatus Zophobacter franzmannii]